MAYIRCRYNTPYCEINRKRIHHNEDWWCDSNDECESCQYTKPENATAINPTCIYCKWVGGWFEKVVRSFDYTDGCLTIGKTEYRELEIKYLEIDGRVLINEGAE